MIERDIVIAANDLHVVFPRLLRRPIRALDGFTVSIARGDIFALLGPNGAGKSTALYCMLGLIRPNRGSVTLFGGAPEPGSNVFDRIAYLPEEPHYHLYLTVEQAVTYYGSLYSTPPTREQVRAAIDRVGLSNFRDLKLEKCSKGMKQKMGIAACLISKPEIVFMDEPTRGLDPIMVHEMRQILLELNAAGATIVVNSHVLAEVETVCNRVAIMHCGRVVAEDSLQNLLKTDVDRYEVVLAAADGPLPDYLQITEKTAEDVRGTIPKDRAADLFIWAASSSALIKECSFKKLSLEEAFMEVIKEQRP